MKVEDYVESKKIIGGLPKVKREKLEAYVWSCIMIMAKTEGLKRIAKEMYDDIVSGKGKEVAP